MNPDKGHFIWRWWCKLTGHTWFALDTPERRFRECTFCAKFECVDVSKKGS